MSPEEITAHLCTMGYSATLEQDAKELHVIFDVGEQQAGLVHRFPDTVRKLPAFDLRDPENYGTLAHVVVNSESGLGAVCVHDLDSISVNFEVPYLAYEDSLRRHIELLQPLILNSAWNRQELLREFHSNWELLCARFKNSNKSLYFACDTTTPVSVHIRSPYGSARAGILAHYLGLDQSQAKSNLFTSLQWRKRQASGKALVLALDGIEPAPTEPGEVVDWYVNAQTKLCADSVDAFARFQRRPGKDFWLIFSAEMASGRAWFAIRFRNKKKGRLPITTNACEAWILEPIVVRALDRESVVPRSGGKIALVEKSVLLVGCGSVGSEIAYRIASTGVGSITISDPDVFKEENLYRHTLALNDIGLLKSRCVASDLRHKFLWLDAIAIEKRLEFFDDMDELNSFDVIVVAIGSPTVERAFHAFAVDNGVTAPIINTWVEAHGVGGHATLDMPTSKGCLRCAYVDPTDLRRGLASNLNFLAPNQDVTVTHGGCGFQYLPYSGIAASYTATMAADLAARYLEGSVIESSKISWVGNAETAQAEGFTMTHRYHHFSKPLKVQPLHNKYCDVCGS